MESMTEGKSQKEAALHKFSDEDSDDSHSKGTELDNNQTKDKRFYKEFGQNTITEGGLDKHVSHSERALQSYCQHERACSGSKERTPTLVPMNKSLGEMFPSL
jgi:hypothetical protein